MGAGIGHSMEAGMEAGMGHSMGEGMGHTMGEGIGHTMGDVVIVSEVSDMTNGTVLVIIRRMAKNIRIRRRTASAMIVIKSSVDSVLVGVRRLIPL
jgi:hypothetical protein